MEKKASYEIAVYAAKTDWTTQMRIVMMEVSNPKTEEKT